MTMYVLSFYGNGEIPHAINGVYGVFDSLARAMVAVGHYCDNFNETVYDYDVDPDMWRYFTNKGTYVIEHMKVNDEGI